MGVFEIARNETLKTLLSGCVPKLQSDYFTSSGNIFTDKVDTNGGLTHLTFTFLVGSNSFRMYLAMMELFPTFWSPTSTILNFCMELRLLEKLILSLIFYNQTK